MAILGAHQSIAGGYDKAVERAHRCGCDCVQLFTKNNNQWAAKDITADEARRFRAALDELGITHPIAHDSLPHQPGQPRSPAVAEIGRCLRRGTSPCRNPRNSLCCHPSGRIYHRQRGASGLRNVVRALDEIHGRTARSAGPMPAGNHRRPGNRARLGGSSNLATILDGVKRARPPGSLLRHLPRLCGRVSAGHAEEIIDATMAAFDRLVGLGADQGVPSERQPPRDWAAGSIATSTSAAASWASSRFACCCATTASATCRCIWKRPKARKTAWIGT